MTKTLLVTPAPAVISVTPAISDMHDDIVDHCDDLAAALEFEPEILPITWAKRLPVIVTGWRSFIRA